MRARIAVVSLRFNPAFIQHLIAFGKMIRELGHDPAFVLNSAYSGFAELGAVADVFEPDFGHDGGALSHAVFLNPSVENQKMAASLKAKGTKVLYVLHEPWQPMLNFVWTEGLLPGLKGLLAHRISTPVIKLADVVILESRYGLKAYEASDVKYNRNCVYFPQIYDDEAPAEIDKLVAKKRYFGFIGALCRSHGFEDFLRFMIDSFQRRTDLQFLIASRNPLPDEVRKNPIIAANLDKVEVRCGRPMSNAEMNDCYSECFCIWNIYRRSTQSGVMPKAFMFGTPVLASSLGSFPEYVQDGVNGKFAVPGDRSRIHKSIDEMRGDLKTYAANCRKTFLGEFFYRSKSSNFQELL
jgi:glycosyltransferase involved in cell wall biosynthesis